jgi:hypothetical protein
MLCRGIFVAIHCSIMVVLLPTKKPKIKMHSIIILLVSFLGVKFGQWLVSVDIYTELQTLISPESEYLWNVVLVFL